MTIFLRPELAQAMTRQLLQPGVLDEGLRSGLFLSGLRRTGKTTFLRHDLIPALEEAGAVVIYVDLWSDTRTSPEVLGLAAVRKTLADLQTPASDVLQKLARVTGADVGAFGFKFGFKLETVGTEDGPTLADALTEVVDQARTDVVLIVDEVQHAITSDGGNQMLLALKSARDAINLRPDTPGHFIFIGTGSHRALVSELTTGHNQAFVGATSVAYPVLIGNYVEYLLSRLADEGVAQGSAIPTEGAHDQRHCGRLPSLAVATQVFVTLGNRPEELLKALRQLSRSLAASDREADPDQLLPVIAATLRSPSADIELLKIEQLGARRPQN